MTIQQTSFDRAAMHRSDRAFLVTTIVSRVLIYGTLIVWTIIALFQI